MCTHIKLGKFAYGQGVEMIQVKKDTYGANGPDVINLYAMKHIKPHEYMVAHMLSYTSRPIRRKMYCSMLKDALRAGNDQLSHFALNKYLLFVRKSRETFSESKIGLLEPGWDAEKQLALRATFYRELKVCRAVAKNKMVYGDVSRGDSDYMFGVKMESTFGLALSVTLGMISSESKEDHWKIPVDHKLVAEAFAMLVDFYGDYTGPRFAAKAYNERRWPSVDNWNKKEVSQRLRETVNGMNLGQVVYFLSTFPKMPKEFLEMFRVEYARKGGAFDLRALTAHGQ